jgi:hypothetical protein
MPPLGAVTSRAGFSSVLTTISFAVKLFTPTTPALRATPGPDSLHRVGCASARSMLLEFPTHPRAGGESLTTLYRVTPHRVTLYRVTPYRVTFLGRRGKSNHALSRHASSRHAVPCHALSRHAFSQRHKDTVNWRLASGGCRRWAHPLSACQRRCQ